MAKAPAFSEEDERNALKWITRLDDEAFEVRQQASRDLVKLGFGAEAFLREQLDEIQNAPEPSYEQIVRLRRVLREFRAERERLNQKTVDELQRLRFGQP